MSRFCVMRGDGFWAGPIQVEWLGLECTRMRLLTVVGAVVGGLVDCGGLWRGVDRAMRAAKWPNGALGRPLWVVRLGG